MESVATEWIGTERGKGRYARVAPDCTGGGGGCSIWVAGLVFAVRMSVEARDECSSGQNHHMNDASLLENNLHAVRPTFLFSDVSAIWWGAALAPH